MWIYLQFVRFVFLRLPYRSFLASGFLYHKATQDSKYSSQQDESHAEFLFPVFPAIESQIITIPQRRNPLIQVLLNVVDLLRISTVLQALVKLQVDFPTSLDQRILGLLSPLRPH